jgi:predicted RNA-binding Zn-ribbon protein involved in translation (DUF1610 family)
MTKPKKHKSPVVAAPVAVPRPLFCPHCGVQHIDKGEWATRLHHKHLCASCGHIWREETYFVGADPAVAGDGHLSTKEK